ncbi:flagellar biosynthetic protein FliO [Rhizobium sp.]|jgi:hypothetical protein|uniref:flagellar biosynthetic protein FliO n=1 Tax=Rhizobium sp. TaxID=391 RepID=UPI000E8BFF98|nr:flagellar biosynthesis protein FliO [Rhizobium sp.]
MIDEILNAYGARFVIAASGVFLALIVLVIVLWIIRNKAPSPFVRGGRSRQPRLQVLDAAAVDTRRRLVLVRRDNIEHLILIGGPTDVVIESGIGEPKAYLAGELAAETSLQQREDAEAFLARQEAAALQTPPAALPVEQPVAKPAAPIRREPQKEAAAVDLILPAETPAKPVAAERPAPPIAKVQPRPTPEVAPERVQARRPQPASPPTAAPNLATTPSPIERSQPAPAPVQAKPQVPVATPEPAKTEAPEIVVAPAATQTVPPVRVEDAALALDAARERILAPKVEPFAAERFKAPVEPDDIALKTEAPPRVDPDMDSIKSEFEKILDTEVLSQPVSRPRPTVEPPVARSIPSMASMEIGSAVKPPVPTTTSAPAGAPASESNLQNEIARIFGEMGAPRKD